MRSRAEALKSLRHSVLGREDPQGAQETRNHLGDHIVGEVGKGTL